MHFASDTLNKMQAMALGAQRSNMMTVPTDCDQRDERLGWMGDANLSGDSMALNFDVSAFFNFFVRTMVSEEGDDGSLPDVVPFNRYGNRPADVSWSAALPNLLHVLWQAGGEPRTTSARRTPCEPAHHVNLPPAAVLWQVDGELPSNASAAALKAQIANVGEQAAKGLGQMHTP